MSIAEPVAIDPAPADLESPRVRMTVDEFLAIPEDGTRRMLLDGEVWEVGVTTRSQMHSQLEIQIGYLLKVWLKQQPLPRGRIHGGDAGFRLEVGASAVGADVAYVSPELIARSPDRYSVYNGPPVLAVEIASPSDRRKAVIAKIAKYLEAGVVVWEVEPEYQLIRVHRAGQLVETYNITQELVGDPYLPSFRVAVAEFFAD